MVNIEVDTSMKTSRGIVSEDIANRRRYSVENYIPIILRAIQRGNEREIVNKCHAGDIEIRILKFGESDRYSYICRNRSRDDFDGPVQLLVRAGLIVWDCVFLHCD